MLYLDLLRAVATLTTIRACELPQPLCEFLLAYGYLRPGEIPGFLERRREFDPKRVRDIFMPWLEERNRDLYRDLHASRMPEWAPEHDVHITDVPGGFYGAAVYLPKRAGVVPRGPGRIAHKKVPIGAAGGTTLHLLSCDAPFVVNVQWGGRTAMIVKSVTTSRSWIRSRNC